MYFLNSYYKYRLSCCYDYSQIRIGVSMTGIGCSISTRCCCVYTFLKMPRITRTPQQALTNALMEIEKSLQPYESREHLNNMAGNSEGNHKATLRRVARYEKIRDRILLQLRNISIRQTIVPTAPPNITTHCCDNCHRHDTTVPSLELRERWSNEIAKRRGVLKTVTAATANPVLYSLCLECDTFLSEPEDPKDLSYKDFRYTWPSFLWHLLTNNSILAEYQGLFIWKLIPAAYRHWWIPALTEIARYKHIYENISVDAPRPIIRDRTDEIKEWNNCMERHNLPEVSRVCNKLLLPTVLCPWGCSEYIHKVGKIPFNIIIQKCLPKVQLPLTTDATFSKVKTMREDYIRDSSDTYENWLLNPLWKISPATMLDMQEGLVILTCNDHNKGNSKYMIHTCRRPHHILPAARPDQLAFCVNRPRTVKPIKKSKFSTTYQMHEQKGSFNGIDTCSVTLFGKFDFSSHLSSEDESRAISQRPDIHAHLVGTLVKEKIIPPNCAKARVEEARTSTRNINFEPYYKAATYVPLHVAVAMQKENACPRFAKYNGFGRNQDETYTFRINWPEHLYHCQTLNRHGIMPHNIPNFRPKNVDPNLANCNKFLWQISSLLLTVEHIWSNLSSLPQYDQEEWQGWLMTYLTRKSVHHSTTRPDIKDPFKFNRISSVKAICEKLAPWIMENNGLPKSLEDIFLGIEGIFCIDLDKHFDGSVNIRHVVKENVESPSNEIIIVDHYYKGEDEIPVTVNADNGTYELRYMFCSINGEHDSKWDTRVSVRHGINHTDWWHCSRLSEIFVLKTEPLEVLPDVFYNLVYCRRNKPKIDDASHQMMSHIGGQTKIKCLHHDLPLIMSTHRKGKCYCGCKEYYRCCDLSCPVKACRKCMDLGDTGDSLQISETGFGSNESHRGQAFNNDDSDSEEEEAHGEEEHDEMDEDTEWLFNREQRENRTEANDEEGSDNETLPSNEDDNYSPLLRDDFNDYVTTADEPDFTPFDEFNNDYDEDHNSGIPSTDSGTYAFDISENTEATGAFNDIIVTGNVLLNQCGTLLTRNTSQIKGSSRGKLLLQKICASTIGKSVPLLQPEATIFSSIFWKMVPRDGVIAGAIPTPLLSERTIQLGFQSLPQHGRTRLTSPFAATSTDPFYITWWYDKLTNLSATHLDTRIAMNRGLTVGSDTLGGLGVRGGNDSGAALLGSIDSNQMVKNLCASQRVHPSSFFCTYTCAQSEHFGTKILKQWIDGDEWKDLFPGYNSIHDDHRPEIHTSMQQCAATLLLRNWQETSKIFIDYLRNSESSPFRRCGSIFARNEYQKDVGNLSHIHLMVEVLWDELTIDEKAFVDELICSSIFDIAPHKVVDDYIKEGIFDRTDCQQKIQAHAKKVLRHYCSSRCQECVGPGKYRCRMPNNCEDSPDNTKSVFIPLPNELSTEVKERLVKLGMIDPIEINELGYETPFKCTDDFFHPSKHIPPTNPTEDINMSPVEGYTFSICKSMQNIQLIKGTGGCNKYVCKYVGKIDEQNYVVVKANPTNNGELTTQSNFLHNTKVAGSKINEEANREARRDKLRPTGRKISLMEMLHVLLKYPEVYTDLRFVDVSTYPLAFRKSTGVRATTSKAREQDSDENTAEDAAAAVRFTITNRLAKGLEQWRCHSPVEETLIQDLYTTGTPIDAITRFSIRPPEMRSLFDAVGDFYRWFSYSPKPCSDSEIENGVNPDLRYTKFIDGIGYQVLMRKKAIPEILAYFDTLDPMELCDETNTVMAHFRSVCLAVQDDYAVAVGEDTDEYYNHIKMNLLDDSNDDLLPVYVFSQIRPTGGINFILHILLSMGRFKTEIEMTVHQSLKECLRQAKLIGPLDDEASLKQYSNDLLQRYIKEQLKYFSNNRRVIMHWIEVAGEVFDSVILKDEIPMTEMPPVQLTSILAIREEAELMMLKEMKSKLTKAGLKEIGDHSSFNLPTYDEIMAATKDQPLDWNPVESFRKNPTQSDESFEQQSLAIKVTKQTIDSYLCLSGSTMVTKNLGIRGFPGGGKTWCSMYCLLYALSKGLSCLATAVMAKRATQLGGTHWHKFFSLPVEKRLTPHRMAECAINKLEQDRVKLNSVLTLDVILADELGQLSAGFISAIDIVLRNLRKSNNMFGGVLIIGTLDHTQIQPWEGRPFLTSPQIIPSFKMVNLKSSVRTNNINSQRIQEIARMNYKELANNPHLIDEFEELCSQNFTFVNNWNHESIEPSTFRVYSRKVPAVAAAREFIANVRRKIPAADIITRLSKDIQKARYTTSDWRTATDEVSSKLEEQVKPPHQLLFFRGAVYECTYNDSNGKFNQSQIALLYNMPTEDTLGQWKPVKVLIAPPALKDVEFDMSKPKEFFIDKGFVETDIKTCPERPIFLSRIMQGQRKQYGLKHRVTGTIHAAMGDTYESMATMISETDKDFGLWDKGQLIVIISRTRQPEKTIFVGDKVETLRAFKSLLLRRTQWTDFMEDILDVVTINCVSPERPLTATPDRFPYQISDIELPQCRSGYVYLISSLRDPTYIYIGKANCLRTRIRQHNSGYGSAGTQPYHLRPFAMMGYICGFGGNTDLMFSIEEKWKLRRNELRRDGINDPRLWARCGEDVLRTQNNNVFGSLETELKLVLLFR